MWLFMTSQFMNQFENGFITTYMKSARIHLLNYYSFRHSQPFSFLDKSTRPTLLFVVLHVALSTRGPRTSFLTWKVVLGNKQAFTVYCEFGSLCNQYRKWQVVWIDLIHHTYRILLTNYVEIVSSGLKFCNFFFHYYFAQKNGVILFFHNVLCKTKLPIPVGIKG